jgi:hypothetical protein
MTTTTATTATTATTTTTTKDHDHDPLCPWGDDPRRPHVSACDACELIARVRQDEEDFRATRVYEAIREERERLLFQQQRETADTIAAAIEAAGAGSLSTGLRAAEVSGDAGGEGERSHLGTGTTTRSDLIREVLMSDMTNRQVALLAAATRYSGAFMAKGGPTIIELADELLAWLDAGSLPVDNEPDPQEVGGSDGGRPEGSRFDLLMAQCRHETAERIARAIEAEMEGIAYSMGKGDRWRGLDSAAHIARRGGNGVMREVFLVAVAAACLAEGLTPDEGNGVHARLASKPVPATVGEAMTDLANAIEDVRARRDISR